MQPQLILFTLLEHFTHVHLYSTNSTHPMQQQTVPCIPKSTISHQGKVNQFTYNFLFYSNTMYICHQRTFNYNQQQYSKTTKQPFGTQHTQFFHKSTSKAAFFTTPNVFGGILSLMVYKQHTRKMTLSTNQSIEQLYFH